METVPGITQKMLTQAPQVEYSLTDLGQSVTKPLAAIRDWSEQHLPDVRRARRRFEELQSS